MDLGKEGNMQFVKDEIKVIKLPDDVVMQEGECAPLYENQFEVNSKITDFLKGKEYLKKQLVKNLIKE